MATYLALTTHNYQQNRYHEIARGNNKAQVEKKALEHSDLNGTDIYAQTYRRNLIIVSKSAAKRKFGFDADQSAAWY